MPVTDYDRIAKYMSKYDPVTGEKRWTAGKGAAVLKATDLFTKLVDMEEITKTILTSYSVPTILYPAYLAFARQCFYAARRHTGGTLATEVTAYKAKWAARTLSGPIMDEISLAIAGV